NHVLPMGFNPDVTVGARGVMEKCTYCIQRIRQAQIKVKNASPNGRVKDGDVVTACQQACPAEAITFGDLGDENTRVAKLASSPRGYRMLEDLNTRPRTSFLARIRNANPALAAKTQAAHYERCT